MTATSLVLSGVYETDEVTATSLPVDLATDTWRTVMRSVVPVAAGDRLDVTARARVTNDVGVSRGDSGYTVGVGAHLWVYDCDPDPGPDGTVPVVSERPWTRIAPSWGDNVSRDRHHLPIALTAMWDVPANWPPGHRAVVVLRADAHSTAWKSGDTLTVDGGYGQLIVRRWTPLSLTGVC
ncbi:hypothetical protein [Streptomyces sp. Amel2xC10]|uniref:hypothetical protein n=1 Tax=Streptomyces sp. Amel2xC10 TaxID=1305826 RepID=UPI000A08EAD1|nr:hypothetical protein [Streptomyces sp. Amel2xC10]SMF87131.1 hypothetical protein SAMN02745830_07239 [Streptomyces sp. Amel2xC10]